MGGIRKRLRYTSSWVTAIPKFQFFFITQSGLRLTISRPDRWASCPAEVADDFCHRSHAYFVSSYMKSSECCRSDGNRNVHSNLTFLFAYEALRYKFTFHIQHLQDMDCTVKPEYLYLLEVEGCRGKENECTQPEGFLAYNLFVLAARVAARSQLTICCMKPWPSKTRIFPQ